MPPGWALNLFRLLTVPLTRREQALADLAFRNGPDLSANWRRVVQAVTFAIAACVVGEFVGDIFQNCLVGIGLLVALLISLGSVLRNGFIFQPIESGGLILPAYAAFGTSYREVSMFLLKLFLAQAPWLLILTVFGSSLALFLAKAKLVYGARTRVQTDLFNSGKPLNNGNVCF